MKLEISGPDGKRTFVTRVGASLMSLGRGVSCDISLPKDPGISDLHLRFNQFVGQWSVSDQFSDSGTFVNGQKVFSQDIKVGDEIRAGATTLRVASMESEARTEQGVAHSGSFDFTTAARTAAAPQAAYTMPAQAPKFESVSSDALQWKDPLPTTANAWPENKPPTVELSPAEAANLFRQTNVGPPQGAGSVTSDAPHWAPTRRDTERMKMQTSVRRKDKARAPKAPPEPPPQGRPPAVFSGTPGATQPVVEPARAAAPWEARQNTAYREANFAPAPKKKQSNLAGCIVALVIGGAIAGGILADVFGSNESDSSSGKINVAVSESHSEKDDDAPPVEPASAKWDSARQKQVSARIKEIKDGLGSPSKKMDDIAALMAKQPPDPPYSVSGSRERAEIMLRYEINMDLSKRLGNDQRDVWNLTDGNRFDEALARLESLKADSQATKWIAEQAEKLEIEKYVTEKTAALIALNDEYIGKTLDKCDELAAGGCNALALKEFETLVNYARFEPAMRKSMELERDALNDASHANPGPVKYAKPAKPKVPAPPKNSLLPEGSVSQSALVNKVRSRLMKAAADPRMLNAPCKVYGRAAKLLGVQEGRLKISVDRPLPSVQPPTKITYTIVKYTLDLPPATIAALCFSLPDPDADWWLSLMLYAYDNGLNDDAARAAFEFNKLKPDARADLEAIMAAKLGIAPPAKGFVEKDGMLVPG